MAPRIIAGAVTLAFLILGTTYGCHAARLCHAGGKQQDALLVPTPHCTPRSPQPNVSATQHRKLLQTSQVTPLEALSNLLRRFRLENKDQQSQQAASAATAVQNKSPSSYLTLEQGVSPYVAARLPGSTAVLQQGAVTDPVSSVTYTTSTYTSTLSLPAEGYSSSAWPASGYSSGMSSAMGNTVPGPLTQRAGVAGILIGMAGDTAGQFHADRAVAKAAFVSKPGSAGHTIVTNTGAIQGELLSGGGHMVGQAVSALGQVGDYATGVTHQVASNLGVGTGGLFNMAGRFVSTLAQLTGPGRNVATKTGKLEYVSPHSSSYMYTAP